MFTFRSLTLQSIYRIAQYTRLPAQVLEDPNFKIFNPETVYPKEVLKPIKIGKFISLQDLAYQLQVGKEELQKVISQVNDGSRSLNYQKLTPQDVADALMYFDYKLYNHERVPRPPIITIMGHVDHGKTTLLDYLRKSQIAQGEFGGITQKIGAFQVQTTEGQRLTFIDTPGHEAFSNMRVRGAQFTDMIILVVSCTDGVQQQTLEVVNIAYNFQIPIIVAVNKIDQAGAHPEMIEMQLVHEAKLALEGTPKGNIPVVHISGKTGQNVDLLLELIQFQGECMQLSAVQNGLAEGFVLEARQQRNMETGGSTFIVQAGTMKQGDFIIIGDHYSKIKVIKDDLNQKLSQATPSHAVEIIGLKHTPVAGDSFFCVENEKLAKMITTKRQFVSHKKKLEETVVIDGDAAKIRIENWRDKRKVYGSEEKLMEKFKEAEERLVQKIFALQEEVTGDEQHESRQEKLEELSKLEKQVEDQRIYLKEMYGEDENMDTNLNLILKGPDYGTVETMQLLIGGVIEETREENFEIKVISTGVGDIQIQDIKDAKNSNAHILTLNTEYGNPEVLRLARSLGIKSYQHRIIYALIDEVKGLVTEMKRKSENYDRALGSGSIKQIFKISLGQKGGHRTVYGAFVRQGQINKSLRYKILRKGQLIVKDLELANLKHFKDEVLQIEAGKECGLTFVSEVQIQIGDEFEAYQAKGKE